MNFGLGNRRTGGTTGIQDDCDRGYTEVMAASQSEPSSDEPDIFSLPVPLMRLLQIAGWDGALPLFGALVPVISKAIWQKPPVAVGVALVLAPPVAALIRAHIG